MTDNTLVYVGDPMCSWCYGFGPQLDRVLAELRARVGCEVLVGGLRPYTTTIMDDAMKAQLRHHWREVEKRSGQPFRFDLLERTDFIYDTEPACRAVTVARNIDAQRALPLFTALQTAFYRDGRDITLGATLADIASENGLDRTAFLARWSSPQARQLTREDFTAARELGVNGFPTLLLQRGVRVGALCRGYVAAEPLIAAVTGALEATDSSQSQRDQTVHKTGA